MDKPLRTWDRFSLWKDGPHQVYRNRHGDHIAVKTTSRRPQIIKTIHECDIEPEVIDSSHFVCSIGWSEREQAYYGWSHRAVVSFRIGDRLFEADYGNQKTPFRRHGRKLIETKADARQAAVNFSWYIS